MSKTQYVYQPVTYETTPQYVYEQPYGQQIVYVDDPNQYAASQPQYVLVDDPNQVYQVDQNNDDDETQEIIRLINQVDPDARDNKSPKVRNVVIREEAEPRERIIKVVHEPRGKKETKPKKVVFEPEEDFYEVEEPYDRTILVRDESPRVYNYNKEDYKAIPSRIQSLRKGYKPSGGDVEIFNEPIKYKARPKIDAYNPNAGKNGGDVEIFNEPVRYKARPKIDSYNPNAGKNGGDVEIFNEPVRYKARPKIDSYNPNAGKNGGDVEIFNEKLVYDAKPKINANNKNYKRSGGDVEIFDEKVKFEAKPKIDAFNKNYKRSGGDVEIFDEKLKFNAKPKIDAKVKNYRKSGGDVEIFNDPVRISAKPKIDAKVEGYRKSGGDVEIFNDPVRISAKPKIDAKVDGYRKSGGNVEIFNEPVRISAKPKIDAKVDGYRKSGGNVEIFNEPLKISAKPKINANNDNYVRQGGDVKIYNEPVKFDVKPKIDAKVDNYSKAGGDVEIFNEPVLIRAKSRIDASNPDYTKSGGNVKIFNEPINISTTPKIDAKNPNYVRRGGDVKIFDEPVNIAAKPKIDAKIENYKKPGGDVKIFYDPINIDAKPRIAAQNSGYNRGGGILKIFNDPVKIKSKPKIDANNKNYQKSGGDVKVFNEKVNFEKKSRVDAFNPDYKRSGGNVRILNIPINVKGKSKIDARNNLKPNKKRSSSLPNIRANSKLKKRTAMTERDKKRGQPPKITSEPIKFESRSRLDTWWNSRKIKNNNNKNNQIKRARSLTHLNDVDYNLTPRNKQRKVITSEGIHDITNINPEKNTLKFVDEFGFSEPNIKAAKPKVSTWQDIDDTSNTFKAKSYTDKFKNRDPFQPMSPKSKVKNWLNVSKSGSPNREKRRNSLDGQTTYRKKFQDSKLPLIQKPRSISRNDAPKRSYGFSNQPGTTTKDIKDPWLVDLPDHVKERYNNRFPPINQRSLPISQFENNITNKRRPINFNNNRDFFADYESDNDERKINFNKNAKVYKYDTDDDDESKGKKKKKSKSRSRSKSKDKKKKKSKDRSRSLSVSRDDKYKNEIDEENNQSPESEPRRRRRHRRHRRRDYDKENEGNDDNLYKKQTRKRRESPKFEDLNDTIDFNDSKTEKINIVKEVPPLKLKVGYYGSLSATASNSFYTMRPKQAVINNNIQKHTSQNGTTDEYRLKQPSSTSESIITRHVSAIGGRQPVLPKNISTSARLNNPAPRSTLPDLNRGQSAVPYYNYSYNYYNQMPTQNSISFLPNQPQLFQDPTTGILYVPFVQYPAYNQMQPILPQNNLPENNQKAPIPYQSSTAILAEPLSYATATNAKPKTNQIDINIELNPIYMDNNPSLNTSNLPQYNSSYSDLVNPHRYLENNNENKALTQYTPDPMVSLYNYKPLKPEEKIDENLELELELENLGNQKKQPVSQQFDKKDVTQVNQIPTPNVNYVGKFHYAPEIDQIESTNYEIDKYEPHWQTAANGFYYRPKSTLISGKTEPIDGFVLSKILFNAKEINELEITGKADDLKTEQRPKSSVILEKDNKTVDIINTELIYRVLLNAFNIREIPIIESAIDNANLTRPRSSQINDSIHDVNNEFEVKHRVNMYALEFSELHPIMEASINPNYIREKSNIPNHTIYENIDKADERAFFNIKQINENVLVEDIEIDNNLIREKSIMPKLDIYKTNDLPIENAFYITKQINENIQVEEVITDSNLIREKSLPPLPQSICDNSDTAKNKVEFSTHEINEHVIIEQLNDNGPLIRPNSSKIEKTEIYSLSTEINNRAFFISNQLQQNELLHSLEELKEKKPKTEIANITDDEKPIDFSKAEHNSLIFFESVINNEVLKDLEPLKLNEIEQIAGYSVDFEIKFYNAIPFNIKINESDNQNNNNKMEVQVLNEVNSSSTTTNTTTTPSDKVHKLSQKKLSLKLKYNRKINWSAIEEAIRRSHRKNDPYFYISSKVNSFENFAYEPGRPTIQIFEENIKIKANSKIDAKLTPRSQSEQLKIFHENLKWNATSKIGPLSFENIHYKPPKGNFEVFSEKLKWNKEAKINSISEIDLRSLNSSRLMMPLHELPNWNERAQSKLHSFENFNYKPMDSNVKIYDEKLRWRSESRIKPIFESDDIKENNNDTISHRSVKIFSEKLNWRSESRLKAISWENLNYEPGPSEAKPFHEKLEWKSESKLRDLIKSGNAFYNQQSRGLAIPNEKLVWKARKRISTWNHDYIKRKQLDEILKKLPTTKSLDPKLLNKYPIHNEQLNRLPENKVLPPVKTHRRPLYRPTPEIENDDKRNQNLISRTSRASKTHKNRSQSRYSQLENTLFERNVTPENKPSWNVASKPDSINKGFNPDVANLNEKRFKWDQELRRRAHEAELMNETDNKLNDRSNLQFSSLSRYKDENRRDDFKLPRIQSPNRRSTPLLNNLENQQQNRQNISSIMNTPVPTINIRQIKKRSKKPRENREQLLTNRTLESRLSEQHKPDLDGFQLTGSSLRVETDTKIRPLANLNIQNSEDLSKLRKGNHLYSSLMTPRSLQSNDVSSYLQ